MEVNIRSSKYAIMYSMKIEKLEQSGFIFETENGFRLALDIGRFTPIEKLEGIEVDAFLVSHIHGDHFSIDHIRALGPKKVYMNNECEEAVGEDVLPFEIVTIKDGDNLKIGDIDLKVFNVEHGPNVSAPLEENFGFLLEIDSKKIYFAGDMFYESGIDVSNLEVDLALIPVGGFYTFGPEEASVFIRKFSKINEVVSMHYDKTPETKIKFLELAESDFKIS